MVPRLPMNQEPAWTDDAQGAAWTAPMGRARISRPAFSAMADVAGQVGAFASLSHECERCGGGGACLPRGGGQAAGSCADLGGAAVCSTCTSLTLASAVSWGALVAGNRETSFWAAAHFVHGFEESILSNGLTLLRGDAGPVVPLAAPGEEKPPKPHGGGARDPNFPGWTSAPTGCLPPFVLVWNTSKGPGMGFWDCVLPGRPGTTWNGIAWVNPESLYIVAEPALCCCPVSIEIVGGHHSGGYAYDPTPVEEKQHPGCEGNSFDVVIKVRWSPSEVFLPCMLEWHEWNSMSRHGDDFRNVDVDEYATESRGYHGVTSPTLVPWARVMQAEVVGVNGTGATLNEDSRPLERRRLAEERNRALKPGDQTIRLEDSPCVKPTDIDHHSGRAERSIHGHIVVRSGCPTGACRPVDAWWTQLVAFGQDGRLESLVFAQSPEFKWSSGNMLRPESSWRPAIGKAGRDWERRFRQWVSQQPRVR
jgi:hypothetical protein